MAKKNTVITKADSGLKLVLRNRKMNDIKGKVKEEEMLQGCQSKYCCIIYENNKPRYFVNYNN